jgi:D-arginine dehydrogenase
MTPVDAVVVGGGIAGVSIAYELAAHGSVVLAEAEPTLAMHTTGRSAAIYAPSYGAPVVRALTVASGHRFAALQAELDLPPVLAPHPALWLACDQPAVDDLRPLIEAGAVRELSTAETMTLCPPLNPARLLAAGVDDTAMDIDVMAVHQGFVRGLKRRGGQVHAGAPVHGIRPDGTGWTVHVGMQGFSTPLVVNAAGAWVDKVAMLAGVPPIGIRPLRRTVALASGAVPPDPAWPLVVDAADQYYFRTEGTRILISPADETPSEPMDAKPDELDIAAAIERINDVTTLGLRSVHTAWAGLRSFVADRLPVVGGRPERPGFAFFAGQGGYGIQMAPALAAAGAAIMLGDPIPADIGVRANDIAPGRPSIVGTHE